MNGEHLPHDFSGPISSLAGPVAFVLTAANLVLGLQFYFRIIILGAQPQRQLLVFFIITSLVSYTAWFVHLWPSSDLYVRIALILEVIGGIVLLMQVIYTTRSK